VTEAVRMTDRSQNLRLKGAYMVKQSITRQEYRPSVPTVVHRYLKRSLVVSGCDAVCTFLRTADKVHLCYSMLS